MLTLITGCSLVFVRFNSAPGHKVRGRVLAGSIQIPQARVRIQASASYTSADNAGQFEIDFPDDRDSLVIAAWAPGYYNSTAKVFRDDTAITVRLDKLYETDNPDYKWTGPAADPQNGGSCGNCHQDMVKGQWAGSSHAASAADPYFLALYYGTDTGLIRERGEGFRKDLPGSKDNCATCHIPGAAVNDPSGVDPVSVKDVSRYGVFCDLCHKIAAVKQPSAESETGTSSISFLRPPEGKNLFFGPFDDIDKPDAYLPLIKKSEICGPCHTGKSGDVEIYNTYNEWKNSPYPSRGIQCQKCHMAPDGVTTNFAPGKGGLERDPSTIPSHGFPGSHDPRFLSQALTMNYTVGVKSDSIKVTVTLYNNKTGHHIPTGSPSRNMILLVDATDENGEALEYLGENRVPWWGGTGRDSGEVYAGHPGRGFAKILQDSEGHAPAPDWKAAGILSDNRIPASGKDISYYYFRAPAHFSKVKVRTKLVYRRFFKETMLEKGFVINDVIMKADSMDFNSGL
jgi:Cytochrome c554 and c-prime